MSQSSKVFAGSALTPTGSAAIVGDVLRIAATKTFDTDFSQYADGTTLSGWPTYTANFVKQTNAGTPVGRINATTGGWGGASYAGSFANGTFKAKVKALAGRFNFYGWFDQPSRSAGVGQQWLGGASIYHCYCAVNYAGNWGLCTAPTSYPPANTSEVVYTLRDHPTLNTTKRMARVTWDTLPGLEFEVPASIVGTSVGLQVYIGSTDYEYIRYWPTLTGGFTATFTPLSVTSLTRILAEWTSAASSKRKLSELFEYQIDGGSWAAVPDDGYINSACTTTIGVRASGLKNDFDASLDLDVPSISIEIAGQWDQYVPASVSAPTSFVSTAATQTSASFTWTDSSSPAAYYDLYQNTVDNSAGATVVEVAPQGTGAITVYGLSDSTNYYFWLRARSLEGALSSFTSSVNVSTPAPFGIPLTPYDFAYSNVSYNSATFSWNNGSGEDLNYTKLYKNTIDDFSTSEVFAAQESGITSYTDYSLTPYTEYYFWAVAESPNGIDSPVSSSITFTTDPVILSGIIDSTINTPTGLTATSVSSGISLTWTAVSGVYGYQVYRAFTYDQVMHPLAIISGNSYFDSSAELGRPYYYRVTSIY